jgi:hypothetical protein
MLHIGNPIYTVAQAAHATGVAVNTIRSWYQRGHFRIGMPEGFETPDVSPQNIGLARYITLRTVFAIGIVGELVKLGVDLERAASAAMRFAHTGDRSDESQYQRLPGELWVDQAWTIITVSSDKAATPKILRVGHEERFIDLLARAIHETNGSDGFVLLVVDDVVKQIRTKMESGLN